MQREIHQSAEALSPNGRYAGDRRRIQHTIAGDAQPPGTFRDQNASIRKKRHTPRLNESLRHEKTDLAMEPGLDIDWADWKRWRWPIDRRRRSSASCSLTLSASSTLAASRRRLLRCGHDHCGDNQQTKDN
jgi:hypothetical protein